MDNLSYGYFARWLERPPPICPYFTQASPNFVAQVEVNGGEIARLPIAIPGWTISLTDISPDGSNALIAAFGEGHQGNSQWVAPVLGGAAKHLEDGEGSVFSPEKRLVNS